MEGNATENIRALIAQGRALLPSDILVTEVPLPDDPFPSVEVSLPGWPLKLSLTAKEALSIRRLPKLVHAMGLACLTTGQAVLRATRAAYVMVALPKGGYKAVFLVGDVAPETLGPEMWRWLWGKETGVWEAYGQAELLWKIHGSPDLAGLINGMLSYQHAEILVPRRFDSFVVPHYPGIWMYVIDQKSLHLGRCRNVAQGPTLDWYRVRTIRFNNECPKFWEASNALQGRETTLTFDRMRESQHARLL